MQEKPLTQAVLLNSELEAWTTQILWAFLPFSSASRTAELIDGPYLKVRFIGNHKPYLVFLTQKGVKMEWQKTVWIAVWWMCCTRNISAPACIRAQRKHWGKWSLDGEASRDYPSRSMRLPMQMDSSLSCTGCPSVPWKISSGTHRPPLHK